MFYNGVYEVEHVVEHAVSKAATLAGGNRAGTPMPSHRVPTSWEMVAYAWS